MNDDTNIQATEGAAPPSVARRKALAKLGLAAGLAYTAPTLLHLDRDAQARYSTGGTDKKKKKRKK